MTTTNRLVELKAARDAARIAYAAAEAAWDACDARQAALDAYYLLAAARAAVGADDDAECAAAWKAYWAANVRAWDATDAYLDACKQE